MPRYHIPVCVKKMTKFNAGKISVLTLVATLVVSSTLLVNSITTVLATPNNSDNVRICHASNSQTNPYENPTVDPDSILKNNGHDSHNGPVWYSGIADHSWGDIIPEFDYDYTQGQNHFVGHYSGKNWTTGEAIWNNGCNIPTATPSSTALSCSINVDPAFGAGNKFSFNQTYNFSANITGDVLNYAWSITPSAPALSSTNLPTTSWTAPAVPAPGVTWILTLNVSDNSDHSASCSTSFIDPTDTTSTPTPVATPTPAPKNDDGGDGLGCATHDCSGNTSNTSQGQVLGASTMAGTGSFEETLYQAIMTVGATLSAFGVKGLKKARKVSKK